jgi:alkaline phosphatase D
LAEFNVLDTRLYRDDQAAGGGLDPPNPEQQGPSRTITGEAQERWLLDGLAGSGARWNVLAQQVFFAQRDFGVGDDQLLSMDAWDGLLGLAQQILGFIAERNISNPVVITGDVHNNWAADLKIDFNDPGSPKVGTEFVGHLDQLGWRRGGHRPSCTEHRRREPAHKVLQRPARVRPVHPLARKLPG